MDRTQQHYEFDGTYYQNSDSAVRVNVYAASGSTDDELQTAFDQVHTLLDHLYTFDSLDGYDVFGYETDVSITSSDQESHNDLIDKGYQAIKGSDYEDEHALVLWVYWSFSGDGPHAFMMGHDIDCSSAYDAWHRQPFVHVSSGDTNLCDIQQGFVHYNEFDDDGLDTIAAPHEVGHALLTMDDGRVDDMAPSNPNQHSDHYIGTRVFDPSVGIYNTVMATGSNPDAVTRGDCHADESSDNERVYGSVCLRDGVGYTAEYFSNNTSINSSSCDCGL